MNVLPVAEAGKGVGVDHAKIIRPIKHDKLTRVASARSFDVGWSWVERSEKKQPPNRSRYGVNKTAFAQSDLAAPLPPSMDEPSDAESSQGSLQPETAQSNPSHSDTLGAAGPSKGEIPADDGLLRWTLARLEEENAFLRSRLIASEENVKTLISLMAVNRDHN
ncbi:MAG: hypothetical protein HQL90_01050 [Magnetococcales bacterium]|nr:hypothetical protein [Magnetococcales bacterium]